MTNSNRNTCLVLAAIFGGITLLIAICCGAGSWLFFTPAGEMVFGGKKLRHAVREFEGPSSDRAQVRTVLQSIAEPSPDTNTVRWRALQSLVDTLGSDRGETPSSLDANLFADAVSNSPFCRGQTVIQRSELRRRKWHEQTLPILSQPRLLRVVDDPQDDRCVTLIVGHYNSGSQSLLVYAYESPSGWRLYDYMWLHYGYRCSDYAAIATYRSDDPTVKHYTRVHELKGLTTTDAVVLRRMESMLEKPRWVDAPADLRGWCALLHAEGLIELQKYPQASEVLDQVTDQQWPLGLKLRRSDTASWNQDWAESLRFADEHIRSVGSDPNAIYSRIEAIEKLEEHKDLLPAALLDTFRFAPHYLAAPYFSLKTEPQLWNELGQVLRQMDRDQATRFIVDIFDYQANAGFVNSAAIDEIKSAFADNTFPGILARAREADLMGRHGEAFDRYTKLLNLDVANSESFDIERLQVVAALDSDRWIERWDEVRNKQLLIEQCNSIESGQRPHLSDDALLAFADQAKTKRAGSAQKIAELRMTLLRRQGRLEETIEPLQQALKALANNDDQESIYQRFVLKEKYHEAIAKRDGIDALFTLPDIDIYQLAKCADQVKDLQPAIEARTTSVPASKTEDQLVLQAWGSAQRGDWLTAHQNFARLFEYAVDRAQTDAAADGPSANPSRSSSTPPTAMEVHRDSWEYWRHLATLTGHLDEWNQVIHQRLAPDQYDPVRQSLRAIADDELAWQPNDFDTMPPIVADQWKTTSLARQGQWMQAAEHWLEMAPRYGDQEVGYFEAPEANALACIARVQPDDPRIEELLKVVQANEQWNSYWQPEWLLMGARNEPEALFRAIKESGSESARYAVADADYGWAIRNAISANNPFPFPITSRSPDGCLLIIQSSDAPDLDEATIRARLQPWTPETTTDPPSITKSVVDGNRSLRGSSPMTAAAVDPEASNPLRLTTWLIPLPQRSFAITQGTGGLSFYGDTYGLGSPLPKDYRWIAIEWIDHVGLADPLPAPFFHHLAQSWRDDHVTEIIVHSDSYRLFDTRHPNALSADPATRTVIPNTTCYAYKAEPMQPAAKVDLQSLTTNPLQVRIVWTFGGEVLPATFHAFDHAAIAQDEACLIVRLTQSSTLDPSLVAGTMVYVSITDVTVQPKP
jgi:hypothetical protein